MVDIWDELNNLPRNEYWERRRKYFLWKNKMDTTKVKYSNKTKEEMQEILNTSNYEWAWLERFEESDIYIRWLYILYENNFDKDLLGVYDAVKKSAMEGNSTAVKTMLELQKEIKGKVGKISETEKDEPNLKLSI